MDPKEKRSPDVLEPKADAPVSRRELLKGAMAAGFLLPQAFQRDWGRRRSFTRRTIDPSQIPPYVYRTLPVTRLSALQEEFERAKKNPSLSRHKAFQDQIAQLHFRLPNDFKGAKSIVILAAYSKPMYAHFHLDGQAHRVMVPPLYYTDDVNAETLKQVVQKDIVKQGGRRVVDVTQTVPLKLLAARSGLGRYGRNGLIFVDKMGSYNLLYAYLTDHSFNEDTWSELRIVDECNHCHACQRTCPTDCINRWSYAVDVDKCLALYNENAGKFPTYVLGSMHHALMGCMKCQTPCPVNHGIAELSGTLEDVSEDETRKILQGTPDDGLLKTLQRKLKRFRATGSRELFPILTRNLRALIRT